GRDACRLCAAAPGAADEHVAAGKNAGPHAGGAGKRAAHRHDLDRCRTRYAAGGQVLVGSFGAAHPLYAPGVSRLRSYAVEVSAVARAYMDAVMALPAWAEWRSAALKETWVLPEDEVDWPTVLRV